MRQGVGVRFHILGPLLVTGAGARLVPLPGARQERLLAALLLNANSTVSIDHLAEVVWDKRIPPTGGRQVRDLMSRLRRLLRDAGHHGDAVITEKDGYRLHVSAEQLDALVFDRLVGAARATGGLTARTALRRALGLWRGSTLMGVDAPALYPHVHRWENRRLTTWEDYLALELDGAAHVPDHVVGELSRLVAAAPYRERPVELLMTALRRKGRTADALEVVHRFNRRLAVRTGPDPSDALVGTQREILS